MNRKLIILLLTLSTVMTGCVTTAIIDEISFLTLLGYDYKDDNKVKITALVPVFLPDEPAKNFNYSTITDKSDHTLGKLQKEINFTLKSGNLMTVLFNKKLATELGVFEYIKYLKRDPTIGSRVYITIIDGDVEEFMQGEYGLRGNAHYIQNLIQHNIERQNLSDINIHRFIFDYYQKGKDPIIPILKQINSDTIEINGVALLKKDKMVGEIANDRLFTFKSLIDRHSNGSINIHSENSEISYENITSKVKFSIKERDPYVININIRLKGVLRDYKKEKLTEDEFNDIEKLLEDKLVEESQQLIKQFQELNIDPIGLGAFAKTKTRGFDFDSWDEQYSDLKVNVNANVTIRSSGTLQ